MEREQIAEKVVNCISRVRGTPKHTILPATSIEKEIGFDSLDMVDLTMELEEEFGTEFSEDVIMKTDTVDEVTTYVAHEILNR